MATYSLMLNIFLIVDFDQGTSRDNRLVLGGTICYQCPIKVIENFT